MSLDDLQLSPFLIKALYENSLVGEAAAPALEKSPSAVNKPVTKVGVHVIPALGENNRNILVLLNDEMHPGTSGESLAFLTNMLRACNIGLPDIALVNCFNDPLCEYKHLNKQFAPAVILFFGTEPHLLGFPVQIPLMRVQLYNGQKYLSAPSPAELANNRELKKELWTSLKDIFSIA